jgi:hypothetical protein
VAGDRIWELEARVSVHGRVLARTTRRRSGSARPASPATSRHFGPCEHKDTIDPVLIRAILRARDNPEWGYWFVEAASLDPAGRSRTTRRRRTNRPRLPPRPRSPRAPLDPSFDLVTAPPSRMLGRRPGEHGTLAGTLPLVRSEGLATTLIDLLLASPGDLRDDAGRQGIFGVNRTVPLPVARLAISFAAGLESGARELP